jgi:hypothetical protein
MNTTREKRLKNLERCLGLGPKLELPLIFEKFFLYKDEPDELIVSASTGNTVWNRETGESVENFIERIKQDVKKNCGDSPVAILLKKDYSGLPEPSDSMPAYTPYPEVLKRINENKQAFQERT